MSQTRLLTAFFDSMADAQRAVDRLAEMGVPRSDIQMTAGADTTSTGVTTDTSGNYEEMGFWASLKSLFVPEEDRHTYAEGLRRGGYLVSLHPTQSQYDKAEAILDDEGTVNLDERQQSWRSEGWAGFQQQSGNIATAAGLGEMAGSVGGVTPGMSSAGMSAADGGMSTTGIGAGATSEGTSEGFRGTTSGASTTGRDMVEVIPVVDEQLPVGKREVDNGRVRVRSYVVKTPV